MSNFCLVLCRFSLCAWVGAAALFVSAGVAEVRSPQFDSVTKNALVGVRFPHYYRFGFTLVATALVTSVLARKNPGWSARRAGIVTGLAVLALAVMLTDYYMIYSPLLRMTQQTEHDPYFQSYHQASKHINLVGLLIVLAAALLACRPKKAGRSAG